MLGGRSGRRKRGESQWEAGRVAWPLADTCTRPPGNIPFTKWPPVVPSLRDLKRQV